MDRARISTTVDRRRLQRCRSYLKAPDSVLLDRALELLLEELQSEREVQAIQDAPYEDDPDLAWEAPPGPDLPYDGEIPAEILELAERRRAAS